jgi:hypothetical protein
MMMIYVLVGVEVVYYEPPPTRMPGAACLVGYHLVLTPYATANLGGGGESETTGY